MKSRLYDKNILKEIKKYINPYEFRYMKIIKKFNSMTDSDFTFKSRAAPSGETDLEIVLSYPRKDRSNVVQLARELNAEFKDVPYYYKLFYVGDDTFTFTILPRSGDVAFDKRMYGEISADEDNMRDWKNYARPPIKLPDKYLGVRGWFN